MIATQQRIAYLCNAMDETMRLQRQITTDSSAATNKVLAIADALRLAGITCTVLSLGRGRQNSTGSWYLSRARRSGKSASVYCAFLHFPLLTHIVTALSLTMLVVRLAQKSPSLTLLSYNRSYHYVPALVVARVLKVRSYLDLEDGYTLDGFDPIRDLKNKITRSLFRWLCPHGVMVANSGLARQLDRTPGLVCYGVATNEIPPSQDWCSARLQVLFSGTLLKEVGCKLLVEAVEMLRIQQPDLVRELHFVVTGKGPYASEFRALAAQAPDWVSFGESLPRRDYLKAISNCHIGLSLRLGIHEMSSTTFPSKVVEYAQYGLLVVSTRTSDVPLLFGDDALYLEDETATALADMLASLPERRHELHGIASRGRARVLMHCSPEAVGAEIGNLLKQDVTPAAPGC